MKYRWLLLFVPLLLSLPFINRAYFVDDNYFVEIARWLAENPGQPYDFRTDDAGLQNPGWEKNGFVRMVNPLGHHYYLALLMKIGGEKTWWLRLGCVFLSCFSALFILGLARRFTDHPLLTTLLILVTPVFWLSSHSLLIDSTMAFFFLGGVYFFFRFTETGKVSFVVWSGFFIGLAILCKYPSVFAIPLTACWLVLRWKKTSNKYLAFISWGIAGMFLLAYSLWTTELYGAPHILAASSRMVNTFGWPKVMSFFVFFSGVTLVPIVCWFVAPRQMLLPALLIFSILLFFFQSPFGGFEKIQALLLALWITTSILMLLVYTGHYPKWVYPRDHFLLFWVIGFIVMMLLVMDWVAARYYLIVVPAIVFLTVRLVEIKWRQSSGHILKLTIIFLFTFTALLAYADYHQAAPSRHLKEELKKIGFLGGKRHFYLGDSFTMSYLKEVGWVPCFPDTDIQVGDVILSKEITMPLVWFWRKPLEVRHLKTFDYPTLFPLKVMDYQGSAGFYASVWGALPFTFSKNPWERFHLFEIVGVKDVNPS